jgi:ABC-type glycerol-3-phosphate transport system permease component
MRHGYSLRRRASGALLYLLLVVGAVVFLLPFWFMVATSFMPMAQISGPGLKLWPEVFRPENYVEAFTVQPMARFFVNSTFVTVVSVLGTVVSCTLGGWGFSRPWFPGQRILFLLVLSVLMIPGQVTMIPLYLIFTSAGWIDTYLPLIVPHFFGSAFYVFMVRQFFLTLPPELDEAARIDGCGQLRIFWSIAIPLVKPAVVTVAVFTFVAVWNEFFTPLLYLNSPDKYTLPLGLTAFRGEGFVHYDYLMPASTVAILPVLAVFLFFQRYFVKGLASTGLKE